MLIMYRAYLPDGNATLGRIDFPDGFRCYTLEPPWRGNARGESCIPEGIYRMQMRESPVVYRTSKGEFSEGWELIGVPGRTHIMIHPGNWARDTDGCILTGTGFGWHSVNGPMVTNSMLQFRQVMRRLRARDGWDIDVRLMRIGWP